MLDFINKRFHVLINKGMEGDGKEWYFWKFYFKKQSGGTFPQRNLCLANILDRMIDQLRRGGAIGIGFKPVPWLYFLCPSIYCTTGE